MKTFEEVWAEKEREGYQYGEDALEQVRFGWELAQPERDEWRRKFARVVFLRDGVRKLARHCDEVGWINMAGEIRKMAADPCAFREQRAPYWGPDDAPPSTVEIIRCKDCGKLGVAIDDNRVTSHKCSGAWETVLREECELP